MLWFCPNNTCFKSRPRKSVTALPTAPDLLPIVMGTNLLADEINFLWRNRVPIFPNAPVVPNVCKPEVKPHILGGERLKFAVRHTTTTLGDTAAQLGRLALHK